MPTYDVHNAKAHFSRLLARVAAGEEVVIVMAGVPVARIVPARLQRARVPGALRDQIWIADDFDAQLPDDLLDPLEPRW